MIQLKFTTIRIVIIWLVIGRQSRLNILVVGGRVSAGEILSSIDLNTHNISLSSRHQINFENPIWLQLLFSPLYYLIEKYNPKSQKKGSSVRNMAGGKTKKMFNKGLINNVGPVLELKGIALLLSILTKSLMS